MINKDIAIVFPGQGAQSVGMLQDIAALYPQVEKIFQQASDVLHYDLWALASSGPSAELDKTMHTQPILLTASYAIWCVLKENIPLSPRVLAGHSLGEYTALLCAEALAFADALKLVAARGAYMQAAVPQDVGAMAALIGLDENAVAEVCRTAVLPNEILAPANFNSIGQIVVAGHKASVERAIVHAKEKGAKLATLIPVSVPSHCELMRPAALRLQELLATITFTKPQIPIINNVDVAIYTNENAIRDGLVRQLYMPVRWVETIQHIKSMDITSIIECGPGKILTGLNKRIDKQLHLMPSSDLASLQAILQGEHS